MTKINDEYMSFLEGIADKFPRYFLDKKMLIQNKDDAEIDLYDLKELLLSKDI